MKLDRRTFAGMLSSAVLGVATPAALAAPQKRLSILMITNDQHRADCLGCMGNPVLRTPHTDRLASEGVLFARHYVQAPQCVPSRSALHTGRYPHVNRTPTNLYQLPPAEHTLASILNDHAYDTATVGELPFAPTNFLGGFRQVLASPPDYDAFLAGKGWAGPVLPPEHRRLLAERDSLAAENFQAAADPWPAELDETAFYAAKAADFLRSRNQDSPFFLHVNFRRPHHPFDPPKPYDTLYANAHFPPSATRAGEMDNKPPTQRAALKDTVHTDLTRLSAEQLHRIKSFYYGMISLNDHYIGEILSALEHAGLADSTIVVFNADHGEMLGDHGLVFKGAFFYEGLVHVPLIIRAPGRLPRTAKVDSLVQEIDVLPTLLELAGVPAPAGIQGRSLVPIAHGHGPKQQAVYSEFPTIKMIRTGDWKLVHYVGQTYGELYDLKNDPTELSNRYGDPAFADAQAAMERRLTDWFITSADPLLPPLKTTHPTRPEPLLLPVQPIGVQHRQSAHHGCEEHAMLQREPEQLCLLRRAHPRRRCSHGEVLQADHLSHDPAYRVRRRQQRCTQAQPPRRQHLQVPEQRVR